MVKYGYVNRAPLGYRAVEGQGSEWPRYVKIAFEEGWILTTGRLRKTGEWSDFTIVADGQTFAVHRVRYVNPIFPHIPF